MQSGQYTSMALLLVGISAVTIGIILIIVAQVGSWTQRLCWSRCYSGFLIVLGATLIFFSTVVSQAQDKHLVALAKAVEEADGTAVISLVLERQDLLCKDVSHIGNGEPLIHRAIDTGKLAIVMMTISNNYPDLEIRDSKGRTPLVHALHRQDVFMTAMLLNRGAKTNVSDADGNSVEQLAIACGLDMISLFQRLAPGSMPESVLLSQKQNDPDME